MNPFIARLAQQASAPLEDMLARLIKTAALVALAAGCAIAASVFLTIDLYLFIESKLGALAAAATIGGLYLLFAAIFVIAALRRPAAPPVSEAAPEPVARAPAPGSFAAASLGAQAAPAPAPRNPAFAANIDAAVDPVIDVLRDAGLEKEVLAIEAGVEVAKQLNPIALVALATGAGLIIGRGLRDRRLPF
jgi:hypothetical protein